MSPTLNPQDSFVDRLFRDWVLVQRNVMFRKGDVVLLRDPGSDLWIVKRLIAQEKEFVATENQVAIVPAGHCWVEGDNGDTSVDSRHFGPVPAGLLDALVVSVIWPFWRARFLDPPEDCE
eukprot:CAMPEP_0194518324 /NCGR_PEP_ID=MMETSP0253-20130528/51710_1 /TAXON_ID=2966 /ORGANISM="Noctiluca scintillans" /LENGTH=119 /DNA_ID=CAMNT_0039362359 /DNA_START=143 /DNA_END=502 /DNA_ORIENTATION=+